MPQLPPIKYVIGLMLENRSFDHLLGFLKCEDPRINGLTGDELNRDSTGEPIKVSSDTGYSGDFSPDPGHDFDDVRLQLYGTYNPPADKEPDMNGFVKAPTQFATERKAREEKFPIGTP
jgi:phospholipase C